MRDVSRIVVETVGVGYEVLIPLSTYYRLPPTGERVALEIRQVVRADDSCSTDSPLARKNAPSIC